MAVYFLLIAVLQFNSEVIARSATRDRIGHVIMPFTPIEIKGNFTNKSHFQHPHIVSKYCNITNWDAICKSNNTRVCAVRPVKASTVAGGPSDMERKTFNNSCYLFLSNMCENPGQEYYIISDSDCESYLARRRSEKTVTSDAADGIDATETTDATGGTDATETTDAFDASSAAANEETTAAGVGNDNDTMASTEQSSGNATEDFIADLNNTLGNSSALRSTKKEWPKFSVDWAFDGHFCPLRCPEIYKPVCFIANRAKGVYMKMFTFVNHCLGDLYYCEHPKEFAGPPGEDIDVVPSDISWVFCAAYKYVSFARFSEVALSMGHYGWLAGDFKSTHIMEPHERMPGYG